MSHNYPRSNPILKGFFNVSENFVYVKSESEIYEIDHFTMDLINHIAIDLKSDPAHCSEHTEEISHLRVLGISLEPLKDGSKGIVSDIKEKKIGLYGDIVINSMIKRIASGDFNIVVLDDTLLRDNEDLSLIIGTSFIRIHDDFKNIHRFSLKNNIPWLKLTVSEEGICLGPIFIPGSTACYDCYLLRWLANNEDRTGVMRQWQILNHIYNEYSAHFRPSIYKIEMAITMMLESLYAFLVRHETLDIVGKEKNIRFQPLEVITKEIIKISDCDCKTHFSLLNG